VTRYPRAGSRHLTFFRRAGLIGLAVLSWLAQPALAADLVQEQATSEIKVAKDASGFHIQTVTRNYFYNFFAAATVDAAATAPLIRQILLIEKTSALSEADNQDPDYQPSQVKVTVFPLTDKGRVRRNSLSLALAKRRKPTIPTSPSRCLAAALNIPPRLSIAWKPGNTFSTPRMTNGRAWVPRVALP
jgi:hypothetical protein